VGGAGPFAGLDLQAKILEQTIASRDQDHLAMAVLSLPEQIEDRTEYLLGDNPVNPAHAIAAQLLQLEQIGAKVAGIPCNTAHAPAIFNVIRDELQAAGATIHLLHMIEEVLAHLYAQHPAVSRVGVLSTTGTARTRLYADALESAGFQVLELPPSLQSQVHEAIYSPAYGLKALGSATPQANEALQAGGHFLDERGAEAIILGCTEIPLAIKVARLGEAAVIDPTLILARALIRHVCPGKLKPLVT